ncbi:uncharacterized protein BCR38DRAFT_54059 [Pseudomassariella vexata]|uniref:Secreted protein n=1 Tax=Pseudomassariella vexata TaxID=1141098 RepID=A0A1Y2DLG1_9PEZI|nr:uncharacterized protein BCR38DRAFT_54059 [Pseudomassariella vexata]ORY60120.1 hypothetical protein BCR38DRAFT_54059 [Pseudomassariella vexata]
MLISQMPCDTLALWLQCVLVLAAEDGLFRIIGYESQTCQPTLQFLWTQPRPSRPRRSSVLVSHGSRYLSKFGISILRMHLVTTTGQRIVACAYFHIDGFFLPRRGGKLCWGTRLGSVKNRSHEQSQANHAGSLKGMCFPEL